MKYRKCGMVQQCGISYINDILSALGVVVGMRSTVRRCVIVLCGNERREENRVYSIKGMLKF